MKQFDFYDNSVANYIAISPTSPQMMFIPTEESALWQLEDFFHNGVSKIGISQTPLSLTSYSSIDPLFPGSKSPTLYAGVSNINVPFSIDPNYADFILSTVDIPKQDLYINVSTKITTLENGIQLLEIPKDRFKDFLKGTYNYGTYYLYVKPKNITTKITSIQRGQHLDYKDVSTSYATAPTDPLRRTYYSVDRSSFLNSVWNFENANYSQQRGRLLGSVVEVYTPSGTLKTIRFVANDNMFNDATLPTIVNLELSPNYIGYESPQQSIASGDVLKIYPRETYFNPIPLTLNFQAIDNSIYGLVRFMKNDVARDITTNIFEVYDDNGITIASDGSIDGKVVQSYQISQVGNTEVRKGLPLS
jgi:hypothetical protein